MMRAISNIIRRCLIVFVVLAVPGIGFTSADEAQTSFDLRELAVDGRMPAAVDVDVKDDTVYRTPKRYRGYPLRDLLVRLPNLDDLRRDGAEIVFSAEDGYQATMSLDDALTANGMIAFRDLDAPAGEDWIPFKQGKQTVTPAPYYLVWPKQDPDDWAYVWPYQLVTIAVQRFSDVFGAAVPRNASAEVRDGFTVFKTYCLKCHSVNLTGGELAPELNVPRSITEYWQRPVLEAFIYDVPSFRAGSKMPSFMGLLTGSEITRAVDYLVHMSAQKICDDANSCAALAD